MNLELDEKQVAPVQAFEAFMGKIYSCVSSFFFFLFSDFG